MSETIEVGALLFEATLQTISTEAFGITMEEILGGKPIPPAGARFDICFEGTSTGPLAGIMKGVEYGWMRPDGRNQVHVHGSIEAPDGARISMAGSGTAALNETTGLEEIRDSIELHTADPRFAWVNTISVWGQGALNLATGQLILRGYVA